MLDEDNEEVSNMPDNVGVVEKRRLAVLRTAGTE
jgi:hypothetical protein